MALPQVFPSLKMDEPRVASTTEDKAAEVATLKREIAEQLGHQCGECLTDALVARWIERLQDYKQLVEVQEHTTAAEKFTYDIDAILTGRPSEVATPELIAQRELRNELELLSRALGMNKMTRKLVEIDRDLPASAVGLDSEVEIDLRDEYDVEDVASTFESPLSKQAPTARLMADPHAYSAEHVAAVEQEVRSLHASAPAEQLEAPELETIEVESSELGAESPKFEVVGSTLR